jgi:hypothetical protein
MKQLISLSCLLLVLYVPQVSAKGQFCYLQTDTNAVVVFGNGLMSTQDDSDRSSKRIEESFQLFPSELSSCVEFAVAYTGSNGNMSDLYESLKQRLGQETVVASFWNWLEGKEDLPDGMEEELFSIAVNFDFPTMVSPEDMVNQLAFYREIVLSGNKVVVVSHSVGNLFANEAHDILYNDENGATPIPSNSFGIAAIATPSSFVGWGGPYTTLVEDGVIAAISLATPSGKPNPLPPNKTNSVSGATPIDWQSHDFYRSYMLWGSSSQAKITFDVLNTMKNLTQPPQIVQ